MSTIAFCCELSELAECPNPNPTRATPQKLARIELRLPMASLTKIKKLNGKYLPPLAS